MFAITIYSAFLPAVGDKAIKKIKEKIREWDLHNKTRSTLEEIGEIINPTVRGWVNYYGSFYKSELDKILKQIDYRLTKWAVKKYKKFKRNTNSTAQWIGRIRKRDPKLLAHWT
ncbi:MAG: hypothetical protein H0X51_00525 [Parachlamydiaceae bacterium]|nr:hypothetical protein [Parachlamydiaceae bacterium]